MKNCLHRKPRLKIGDKIIYQEYEHSSSFYQGIIIGPKHKGKYPIHSTYILYPYVTIPSKRIWLNKDPIIIESNGQRVVVLND